MTLPTGQTSDIAIIEDRPAMSMEWDAIYAACPYATFFHGRTWAEIWQEYSKGRIQPAPRYLRFSDGVDAVLPASIRTSRFRIRHTALSSPAGTYGGPCSEHLLTADHMRLLSLRIQQEWRNLQYRDNPYLAHPTPPFGVVTPDTTQRIDLRRIQKSCIEIQNRGHKSSLNKARTRGIRVERVTSAEEWASYARMYQASVARWGSAATNHYRSELFTILHRHATHNPDIVLWLAKYEGKPVAGALTLSTRHITTYWHGAALEDYFELRPANPLLTEAIDSARATGRIWFDFNPSGGHAGVAHFKSGFGASPANCSVFTQASTARRLSACVRRMVAKASK